MKKGDKKGKDSQPSGGGPGDHGGDPGKKAPGGIGDKKEADGLRPHTAVLLQYAHVHSPVGTDLQDMVLWHPLLIAEDCTARVAFDLSARPARYRILVYGHTAAGRLGVFHGKLETAK